MLKKEVKEKFNKKYYLLGKRKEDDKKVWLEEASWDCNWYWGLGYIEVFNYNYTDIEEHTHFDSLFFGTNKGLPDAWYDYFDETVLDKDGVWKILEIMKTLYTVRAYSDMLHLGGSNISSQKDVLELVKNDKEYERINQEVIPQLLEKLYELLG